MCKWLARFRESIGWNRRLPVLADPEVHQSDIRITTNGTVTHYDIIITAAPVFNAQPQLELPHCGLINSKEDHNNTLLCARKAITPN